MTENNLFELSTDINELSTALSKVKAPDNSVKPKVHASSTAGNVYFLYEKVRNAVEYREQSLFRKSAIERYLKRIMIFGHKSTGVGEDLICEMIKTRYIANDSIPKQDADKIDLLVANYLELQKKIIAVNVKLKKDKLHNEIVNYMACEIERILAPRPKEDIFLDFTFNCFKKHANIAELGDSSDSNFSISLYSAVHRSLERSDIGIIRYYLFKASYPNWAKDEGAIDALAREYLDFTSMVDSNIQGRTAMNVYKVVRKNIAPYIVLKNVLLGVQSTSDVLDDPNHFQTLINIEIKAQYKKVNSSLINSIVRSIIFIFLTKMLIAIAIEVPYDYMFANTENHLPILLNLFFPPLYLIIVGASIKSPGEKNAKRIVKVIEQITYSNESDKLAYNFRSSSIRSSLLNGIFNFVYGLTFIASIGGLIWLLLYLKFSPADGVVFFIFLSTVSFFGLRIIGTVKEIFVGDIKRGFLYSLWDFIYTPFIKIGQWLSDTYSKINIMTYILDFFIEAPLKSILAIFEQWTAFLKEKREDIY